MSFSLESKVFKCKVSECGDPYMIVNVRNIVIEMLSKFCWNVKWESSVLEHLETYNMNMSLKLDQSFANLVFFCKQSSFSI